MPGVHNDTFIRVPPDGAGKRILQGHLIHLDYTAAVASFIRGTEVVGAVSATKGLIVHVNEDTGTVGSIVVLPDAEAADHHLKYFTANEDLLVDSIPIAKAVDQGEDLFINKFMTAGGNNPYFLQQVDARGAASVRFAEGSMLFDAAGRSQTSEQVPLATYTYPYEDDQSFANILTAGGTATYNANDAAVVVACTTAAGDAVLRRSNQVFKTIPGGSMAARLGIRIGDTGKTNVTRRWGMFSDEDGLFWEMVGTQLRVAHRRGTGGVVNTHGINQEDWNTDRLDGTGPSRVVLHPEYPNIYWLDYQWAGGGRLRFGIYGPEGRIVAHVMDHINDGLNPAFRTGSLPMSVEQINTGIAASTSEMVVYASSVLSDGTPPSEQGFGGIPFGPVDIDGTDFTIIGSFRPALTINGRRNNGVVIFNGLNISAMSTDWLTEVPITLAVGIDHPLYGGLTGAVWEKTSFIPGQDTIMEVDRSATAWAGLFPPIEMFHVKGVQNITMGQTDYASGMKIGLGADNTQLGVVLLAKCMNPAGAAKVSMVVNWSEVKD